MVVDQDRMAYWTQNGAQVSERVTFLLKNVLTKVEAKAAKAA